MKNLHHLLRKTVVNVAILGALLLSLLGTTQPVSAASIQVNVFKDVFGDGKATCSLREAIYSANNDIAFDGCVAGLGNDTIRLSSGTYEISIGVTDYKGDALDEEGKKGDLDIWSSMVIVGAGESNTVIRPVDGAKTRIFQIMALNANVTIQQLTLTNGYAYDDIIDPSEPTYETLGGAIYNQFGRLNLIRTIVTGNTASHSGGGIYSDRESSNFLRILDSTISENYADLGDGGGIASESSMLVQKSLIWNNTVNAGFGGGIYNSESGQLSHVTVAENKVLSTSGRGSGIYADMVIEVLNSTIVHNISAAPGKYGIELSSGQGVIFNNIIAYNKASDGTSANCWFNASVVGASNYREVNDPACTGNAGSGYVFFVTEPGINLSASLDYNLGRTMSYALQSSSKLIDKGQPENRYKHPNGSQIYYCAGRDQRNAIIPMDGDKNGSRICDPGAVEFYPDGAVFFDQLFLPMLRR